MTDTTEIVVRVPGYAQAQLDRGDSLHPIPGLHRIVDTRTMHLVGRAADHRLHVIDEDGRLIQMDDAFFAAFATEGPAPEPPQDQPVAVAVNLSGSGELAAHTGATEDEQPEPEVAEAKPPRRRKADKAADADPPAEETQAE